MDPNARVPVDLSSAPRTFEEVEAWLEPGQGKIIYTAGTDEHGQEGYHGRTAVIEMMTMSPNIRRLINEMAPAAVVHESACEEGMLDFQRSAMLKVAQGLTSFDEMQRALPNADEWAWSTVSRAAHSSAENGRMAELLH